MLRCQPKRLFKWDHGRAHLRLLHAHMGEDFPWVSNEECNKLGERFYQARYTDMIGYDVDSIIIILSDSPLGTILSRR